MTLLFSTLKRKRKKKKPTKIFIQNWSNGDSNQGHLFDMYSSTPLDQDVDSWQDEHFNPKYKGYEIMRIIHVHRILKRLSCKRRVLLIL